jgi:hypothetical protein
VFGLKEGVEKKNTKAVLKAHMQNNRLFQPSMTASLMLVQIQALLSRP